MNAYDRYLEEIEQRKEQGLHAKPIDGAELVSEIVTILQDPESPHREDALRFFTYNTLPGTTAAAGVKARFLQQVVSGEVQVEGVDVVPRVEGRVRKTCTRIIRLLDTQSAVEVPVRTGEAVAVEGARVVRRRWRLEGRDGEVRKGVAREDVRGHVARRCLVTQDVHLADVEAGRVLVRREEQLEELPRSWPEVTAS